MLPCSGLSPQPLAAARDRLDVLGFGDRAPAWLEEREEIPNLLDQERKTQIFSMRTALGALLCSLLQGGILRGRLELNPQDPGEDSLFFWPLRSSLLSLNLIPAQKEFGNCCSLSGILRAGKDLQGRAQPSPLAPLLPSGVFQVSHPDDIPWDGPAARAGMLSDEEEVEHGNADPGKHQADVQHLEWPRTPAG